VKEFWDVFREDGVKIPVRGYEMMIDTGNNKPIAVRKPRYGLHEAPIMQKILINSLIWDLSNRIRHLLGDLVLRWLPSRIKSRLRTLTNTSGDFASITFAST
jgi:hypothetical protein